MSENLHSSLPVEYKLKYGTAHGNADLKDFVNQSSSCGLGSIDGGLPEKVRFGLLGGHVGTFMLIK